MTNNAFIRKLEPGDILLVSEKGIKHTLNRMLGRSKWHHVMLFIGQGKVLEVTPKKGCHISSLDLDKKSFIGYKAIRNKALSASEKENLVAKAIKTYHGKNFSWLQLMRASLRRVIDLKSNGVRKLKPDPSINHNSERMICSNTIAMVYHRAGHLISERHKPEHIMPRDYDKAKGFEVVFDIRL